MFLKKKRFQFNFLIRQPVNCDPQVQKAFCKSKKRVCSSVDKMMITLEGVIHQMMITLEGVIHHGMEIKVMRHCSRASRY